ncbi:hypothetical protein [Nocardia fusca]|uniref:Uncharacterized protein n=1 Tax=Nocardia fusca TaxID=941183 RepID=A0ABV3F7Q4_9NOCA
MPGPVAVTAMTALDPLRVWENADCTGREQRLAGGRWAHLAGGLKFNPKSLSFDSY